MKDKKGGKPALFQDIDYSKHPGFKGIPVYGGFDDEEIESCLHKVENSFFDLSETEKSEKEAAEKFLKQTEKCVAELKQSLRENAPDEEISALVIEVFDSAYEEIIRDLAFKCLNNCYRAGKVNDQTAGHLESLKTKGMSPFKITGRSKDAIAKLGSELRSELVKKYDGDINWRGANPLYPHKGLGREVSIALNSLNMSDIMSEYKSCNMELAYIAVDYSHERQTWWKGCYDDAGLPLSKTRYMHFDNNLDIAKVMFYLSDYVGPENGPTCFVEGSHGIERSYIRSHIFAAMDRIPGKKYFNKETDNYYRPLFKSSRDILMKFPASFRGTTHFGDDLIDGGVRSETLLEKEFQLEGEVGTGVIFDGYRGIHRGSNVDSGERLALQIAYIDKSKIGMTGRVKKKIRSFLRI